MGVLPRANLILRYVWPLRGIIFEPLDLTEGTSFEHSGLKLGQYLFLTVLK